MKYPIRRLLERRRGCTCYPIYGTGEDDAGFSTIWCWDALESPKIMVYTVLLSRFIFSLFLLPSPVIGATPSLDSKAWQDMDCLAL